MVMGEGSKCPRQNAPGSSVCGTGAMCVRDGSGVCTVDGSDVCAGRERCVCGTGNDACVGWAAIRVLGMGSRMCAGQAAMCVWVGQAATRRGGSWGRELMLGAHREHRRVEGAASADGWEEVIVQMQAGTLLEQQGLLQYSKGVFIHFP